MKQLVPVMELPSLYGEGELTGNEKVTWDFELPGHLDAERIVIDMNHLSRIQKVASFSANHVVIYDGSKPDIQPVVTGFNSDGTASAGFISIAKEAIRSREELVSDKSPDLLTDYFKTDVRNEIDKSQIISQIADRRRVYGKGNGPTNEQMWADAIDTHLQLSIRRAARAHLLGRTSLNMKLFDAMWPVAGALAMVEGIMSHNPAIATTALSIYLSQRGLLFAHDTQFNMNHTGESLIRERRWSLFSGMQPDRYLALDTLTRVNSLIKVKK